METERNIDRLAGWIMKLGVFVLICAVCWYFRSVLVYVLIAFVVSLISIPTYTVARVIAARFFYKHKAVRRLMPDIEAENTSSLI